MDLEASCSDGAKTEKRRMIVQKDDSEQEGQKDDSGREGKTYRRESSGLRWIRRRVC